MASRRNLGGYILSCLIGVLLGAVLVSSMPASAATTQAQINALTKRVARLESKTRNLSTIGNYSGSVSGWQVSGQISASQIGVPSFCSGKGAVWGYTGLSC